MRLAVKKVFRDKLTKALYKVDDVVEFQDENRIEDLVNRGLCEEVKDDDNGSAKISIFDNEYDRKEILTALKSCDVRVAVNISTEKLIEKINQLDEETIAKLQEALEVPNT
jgi:hypothetical protein